MVKSHKNRRDPDRTREAILQAAGTLLAKHGPEGLSVSQVAKLAGVNRGTPYQHFQTREQLLKATKIWVSEKLCREVFGGLDESADTVMDLPRVVESLAEFAMAHPELSRVWLFMILSSSRPAADLFWNRFKVQFERFAQSALAQPGMDAEVNAAQLVTGVFLWPVWARAQTLSSDERRQMARRYSSEVIRQYRCGNFRDNPVVPCEKTGFVSEG